MHWRRAGHMLKKKYLNGEVLHTHGIGIGLTRFQLNLRGTSQGPGGSNKNLKNHLKKCYPIVMKLSVFIKNETKLIFIKDLISNFA